MVLDVFLMEAISQFSTCIYLEFISLSHQVFRYLFCRIMDMRHNSIRALILPYHYHLVFHLVSFSLLIQDLSFLVILKHT